MFGWRKRSREADELLRELAAGATLKVHRDVDGGKVYRLHPLAGPTREVDGEVANDLERRGLIRSNMKFPVATFLLTEKGSRRAGRATQPVSSRSYFEFE